MQRSLVSFLRERIEGFFFVILQAIWRTISLFCFYICIYIRREGRIDTIGVWGQVAYRLVYSLTIPISYIADVDIYLYIGVIGI